MKMSRKNPHAVSLGRKGGSVRSRAKSDAAKTRWKNWRRERSHAEENHELHGLGSGTRT